MSISKDTHANYITHSYIGDPANIYRKYYMKIIEKAQFVGNFVFSQHKDSEVVFNTPVCMNGPVMCDACDQEQPGISWDDEVRKTICFDCIRDMAIHHQAQQSWLEKHGDPLTELRDRVAALEEQLKK